MKAPLRALAWPLARDKSDTLLLLAAMLAVLLPHTAHLPPWIAACCGATLLWRALRTWRGLRMPSTLVLLPLAIATVAGVYATYHRLLGRDAGVAMLVLLVAFKTLEMHARRDLFVVVFLGLFLVLTNFFYSQSMGTAAMMVFAVFLLLCAQQSFQYTGAVPPLGRRLRRSAALLGMAAPLALALFIGFPRISGSLWGLPSDATSGRGGLSDSMTPGSIASMAESEETAFRAHFEGAPPVQNMLYWRAIVLAAFDGRSWRRSDPAALPPQQVDIKPGARALRYSITREPDNTRWVLALELPTALPVLPDTSVAVTSELELIARTPFERRVRYEAQASLGARAQARATPAQLLPYLALPQHSNPRAYALGRTLAALPPRERVNAMLVRIRRDGYSYTLNAPLLGEDAIDEFLFDTRAGFCEHYAGAFVFVMRAAGVPARVVTGYQGGELNPVDGYLTVRQSDAHAWAEVWIDGLGWMRIDPTAAVAPDRVEKNLAQALPPRTFGLGGIGPRFDLDLGLGRTAWLRALRFRMDALNNSWNQWVFNYTPQRQHEVLDSLAGALLSERAAFGAAVLAALLGLATLLARRARGKLDVADALYLALCQLLAKRGYPRAPDEGPSAYGARLQALLAPGPARDALLRFTALYSAHKYSAHGAPPKLAATFKSLLDTVTKNWPR
ncbi:MAG: DUF3488 and DUF4129 domain-containing transglutaminase family protein [Pseudomonadota bacterium]